MNTTSTVNFKWALGEHVRRAPRNVRRAIANYGEDICRGAYHENSAVGNGASTIAHGYGLTTNQADAAINAGRWLSEND